MTHHDTETRFARAVLITFALVGLLHIPAFYFLVWDAVMRPDARALTSCEAPRK